MDITFLFYYICYIKLIKTIIMKTINIFFAVLQANFNETTKDFSPLGKFIVTAIVYAIIIAAFALLVKNFDNVLNQL